MAIDLEAIRRRIAQLSGDKTSRVQLWKPGPGEHKIRCLPWPNPPEGLPFIEKWFYYIGKNRGFLSPKQFGKADPIDQLVRKLYGTGDANDRAMAKELSAKFKAYAPVIVRGEEDKGVQIWGFSKQINTRLLSFFIGEDPVDILDPLEGFDLRVEIKAVPGKMFNGKPSYDTFVDPLRRPSKLSEDASKIQKWMDGIPNIDDMYEQKSTSEIEAILSSWLNGEEVLSTDSGTSRGKNDQVDEALDQLAAPTTPAPAVATAPAADKAPAAKKTSTKKTSIDDAFAELEG